MAFCQCKCVTLWFGVHHPRPRLLPVLSGVPVHNRRTSSAFSAPPGCCEAETKTSHKHLLCVFENQGSSSVSAATLCNITLRCRLTPHRCLEESHYGACRATAWLCTCYRFGVQRESFVTCIQSKLLPASLSSPVVLPVGLPLRIVRRTDSPAELLSAAGGCLESLINGCISRCLASAGASRSGLAPINLGVTSGWLCTTVAPPLRSANPLDAAKLKKRLLISICCVSLLSLVACAGATSCAFVLLQPCSFPESAASKRSVMGVGPSKVPGTECSYPGCDLLCVDSCGHRTRWPGTARACAVCNKWYCGLHRPMAMKEIITNATANGGICEGLPVYKCKQCVGTHRAHPVAYS